MATYCFGLSRITDDLLTPNDPYEHHPLRLPRVRRRMPGGRAGLLSMSVDPHRSARDPAAAATLPCSATRLLLPVEISRQCADIVGRLRIPQMPKMQIIQAAFFAPR